MLLVFHWIISQTIEAAAQALQTAAVDLTNASKRLQVYLEEIAKYRYVLGDLKTQVSSVTEKCSINPEFPETCQKKAECHFDEI